METNMKKLLVLAMILAMSSAANANFWLQIVGPVNGTVTPGQVVTVNVMCDASATATVGLLLTMNGHDAFDISHATNIVNSNVHGETVLDWTGVFPGQTVIFADCGIPVEPIPLYSFSGYPKVVGNILVTAPQRGSMSVNLQDDNWHDYGTTTLSVVPEPMTLGILGLGGLLIKRVRSVV
jgi:hypothetical protein